MRPRRASRRLTFTQSSSTVAGSARQPSAPSWYSGSPGAKDMTTLHAARPDEFAAIVRRFPHVHDAMLVVARLRMARVASSKTKLSDSPSGKRGARGSGGARADEARASLCCASMQSLTNDDVARYQTAQDEGIANNRLSRRRSSAELISVSGLTPLEMLKQAKLSKDAKRRHSITC